MEKKIMNGTGLLRRVLLLCLCAALLCPAAFAETVAGLANTEHYEGIQDYCVLPDGRLVFTGFMELGPDAEVSSRGRLLCLNPDRTVCWEYTDNELYAYGNAAVAGDNLLAVFYYDGVKFFTFDGQPTGKHIPLFYTGGEVYGIFPSGIVRAKLSDDGEEMTEMNCTDWEGNELFRVDEPGFRWFGQEIFEDGDGLVLTGMDENSLAVVIRFDGQGNKTWKTVLPALGGAGKYTLLEDCVRTADGGYAASLGEYSDEGIEACAVVRLDPEGSLLWMENTDARYRAVAEYNGKIAAVTSGGKAASLDCVWFGADGKKLGTVERQIAEAELPPYVDRGNMYMDIEKLVPAGDGLWALASFWGVDDSDPEDPDPAWTQQDCALVLIPEA